MEHAAISGPACQPAALPSEPTRSGAQPGVNQPVPQGVSQAATQPGAGHAAANGPALAGAPQSGLALARSYFAVCRPLLEAAVPDVLAYASVGLSGEGSECFGCDDALSRDHDFGPGFCLWVPAQTLRARKDAIIAAIATLPAHHAGLPSRFCQPRRPGRPGVWSAAAFFGYFTNLAQPPRTPEEWLAIPEHQLAACTNGAIFTDHNPEFSTWRHALLAYWPQDVWLAKLAGAALRAGQAGQYNLPRCLKRGETTAAWLAAARFAEAALGLVYLLNRRYMPFYKWAPRLARTLPVLGHDLTSCLAACQTSPDAAVEPIETFCAAAARALVRQNLSGAHDDFLWQHGQHIAARLSDPALRRRNLLAVQ